MRQLILAVPVFLLSTVGLAWADDGGGEPQTAEAAATKSVDPLDLPPDQFFNQDLTVYSPAKKLQKLKNVPSAVYVMTSEDIRRSGAATLIDVFRLLPGIEVARVSAHEWAITARGFNQVFGNKILLLIDGAPVETPIFNGILWENINIPLDTIDRIEVVRGPGAANWGTRAMNGLINVITKSAFTFPYNVASAGGGNEHIASVYGRTGKVFSEHAAVQAYVKEDKYNNSESPDGTSLDDDWNIVNGHIRADLKDENDSLRIISDVSFRGADFELGVPTLNPPYTEEQEGHRQNNRVSLSMLWDHDLGDDSQVSVEWSNMYELRNDFLLDLSAYYSELEVRHRFRANSWNEFAYGANFRFYTDSTDGSTTLSFDPESRSLEFYRLFAQDEISLIDKVLTLTIGSRFEQNDEVGFNAMPTARLLWTVNDRVSLWTAASYTTGSPARVYDDVRLNAAALEEPTSGLPAVVQVTGNRDLDSEKLNGYEVGAWIEPIDKLYVSGTGYYFHYRDLADFTLGDPNLLADPSVGPYLLIPNQYTNGLDANSIGGELTADWAANDWFGLGASYSYFHLTAGPRDNPNHVSLQDNPRNTFSLRMHFTFSPFQIDPILRSVDVSRPEGSILHSYVESDLRIGWQVKQKLELEIIGRNLLHDRHDEFGNLLFNTPQSTVSRSVFVQASYTF
jgi:iron complex outermembrane receptor protein